VRFDAVPQPLELLARELLVRALRLLQAQHVGPLPLNPLEDERLAGDDGVDVPGCDLHFAAYYIAGVGFA
jgi:hypothetical protein